VARLGLMLYTVREDCARDFEATLRSVAALGYEGVELFDLHGHDAAAVRGWLDELGLVACGRHAGLDALEASLPELAAECRELGVERLVLSWLPPMDSAAAARETAEGLRGLADRVAEHGLRFGFHNHDSEVRPLDGGGSFLDELLREDGIFLELDLGWAWYAGVDPIALLGRARGRCPLVHVKDFAGREGRPFRPVGDGAVGYETVAPAAVDAGAEWLLVEQDTTEGPALDAADRSLRSLETMLGGST
jgi:sugar phosphate isomerase/epimerase